VGEFVTDQTVAAVLTGMEAIGVVAFALSGILAATRARFDVVGVTVVAMLTALGGGTLRDLLLDRQPFFWIANELWLWVILGLSVVGAITLRSRHFSVTERAIQWPDAIGLGVFSAVGTQLALNEGTSPLVAALMGVVTASVGGILRDTLLNKIPWVVASYQLYAIIAFAGGWLVWGLQEAGLESTIATAIGAVAIALVRVLALAFNWHLPNWRRFDDTEVITLPEG
jgi:Predicted membrane protein